MDIFFQTDGHHYSRHVLIRFIDIGNRTNLQTIYSNGIGLLHTFYILKKQRIIFFTVSKKYLFLSKNYTREEGG